jgi:hypothetical protein
MPKQKITISIDSEIAKKLRTDSIDTYGDARSMSRLIEDLATGAVKKDGKPPEACSILGHRSEYSFKAEVDFKKTVENITGQLSKMVIFDEDCRCPVDGPALYFALKEAIELKLNTVADYVNECPSCHGLDDPLPKYPDAGRNFEIYATMNQILR